MIVHVARPRHERPSERINTGSARLPLYLRGRIPTQVDTDGPAFLVRRAGKAPTRYPFSRVARIISGPGIEWSTRAFTACLERDIPIVFLDRDGRAAGYLHSRQRSPSHLDTVMAELLDRPDGAEHYALWLRAERMRTLQEWRRTRAESGRLVNEEEFRELLRRHVYHTDDAPAGMLAGDLYRSAVSAYVLQQLQRCGAKPIYWDPEARPAHLANDLEDLLILHLVLEMHGLGNALHGDEAALLTVLHNFGEKLRVRCVRLLGRLHKHIREILEEWP